MTRRDFLRRCAALAGALALPPEVLALPRELAPPYTVYQRARQSGKSRQLWACCLRASAGATPGVATLWRGAQALVRVYVGRHGYAHWNGRFEPILWAPNLRLVVSEGVVAAVPFADRVLFASDTEQRWLSTARLP